MANVLTPAEIARQRASQTSGLTEKDAEELRKRWVATQADMIFKNMSNDRSPNLPAEAFKGALEMGNMLIGSNYDNLLVRGDTEQQWDALAFTRSIPFRPTIYATARVLMGN